MSNPFLTAFNNNNSNTNNNNSSSNNNPFNVLNINTNSNNNNNSNNIFSVLNNNSNNNNNNPFTSLNKNNNITNNNANNNNVFSALGKDNNNTNNIINNSNNSPFTVVNNNNNTTNNNNNNTNTNSNNNQNLFSNFLSQNNNNNNSNNNNGNNNNNNNIFSGNGSTVSFGINNSQNQNNSNTNNDQNKNIFNQSSNNNIKNNNISSSNNNRNNNQKKEPNNIFYTQSNNIINGEKNKSKKQDDKNDPIGNFLGEKKDLISAKKEYEEYEKKNILYKTCSEIVNEFRNTLNSQKEDFKKCSSNTRMVENILSEIIKNTSYNSKQCIQLEKNYDKLNSEFSSQIEKYYTLEKNIMINDEKISQPLQLKLEGRNNISAINNFNGINNNSKNIVSINNINVNEKLKQNFLFFSELQKTIDSVNKLDNNLILISKNLNKDNSFPKQVNNKNLQKSNDEGVWIERAGAKLYIKQKDIDNIMCDCYNSICDINNMQNEFDNKYEILKKTLTNVMNKKSENRNGNFLNNLNNFENNDGFRRNENFNNLINSNNNSMINGNVYYK